MAERESFPAKLEQRARRAIIWHALLRWESAMIIGFTLIVSAFLALLALAPGSQFPLLGALVALGVGSLVEAIIFVSSVTDAQENARVVADLLRDQYQPKRLQSVKFKTQVNKALEYQSLIAGAVQRTREGVLRDRLARAAEPVSDWIDAIYRLASRLDGYEQDQVIRQDLRSVPPAIENFKRRLAEEDDPAVQATLRNTIGDKQRQWEHLSHLQNTMEKAEYQLESTLAALGTVYAQLQTIDLRGAEKGHAERLREEIDEQVAQLQDLSQAMDEVYQAR
jgi:hypothetical protein